MTIQSGTQQIALTSPPPEESDRLLAEVNELLTSGTFDPKDSERLQQMVAALADSRGMIRLGFVEAFGKIGQAAAPYLMEGLANNPNPVIRRSCGKALAKISDPAAIPILINALLHDEDTVARSSAAGAVAKMGAPVVPALLEILGGSYEQAAKGHAAWALGFMAEEIAPQLYEAMGSDNPDVRTAVAGALAKIAGEEQEGQEQAEEAGRAIAILIKALEDPITSVRVEAAATLGQIRHQGAVTQLISLLDDPDLEVRRTAILALGKIGDRVALEPLQAKIAYEVEQIRAVAKLAISQIENN
ncbi:MAG: HEAT repeat domain-containing protein [Oscillatoria sp. SIO1A7]|nr:HEAT repeat domain-containing protein [Oscillatoria sp. SIO1A7]